MVNDDNPMILVCEGCGNEIDPEWCWCGQDYEDHKWENHPFIPGGCDCHRDKSKVKNEKETP